MAEDGPKAKRGQIKLEPKSSDNSTNKDNSGYKWILPDFYICFQCGS